MNVSNAPFDDIRALIARLPPSNASAAPRTARPALGQLDALAQWLTRWRNGVEPNAGMNIGRPVLALFAASHGVDALDSNAARTATRDAMSEISSGRASVSAICSVYDLGVKIFELALDQPPRDFTLEPTLEEKACAATIAYGMEAIAEGADLLCLSEIGEAGAIAAAAVICALHREPAPACVESFQLSEKERADRVAAVERAMTLHADHLVDPLEILRRLGGRVLPALIGAIVAARMERVPVILDGYAALAAAAVLHAIEPDSIAHCVVASAKTHAAPADHEPQPRALRRLGLASVLDFGLRDRTGCGGALAFGVVKAAAAIG